MKVLGLEIRWTRAVVFAAAVAVLIALMPIMLDVGQEAVRSIRFTSRGWSTRSKLALASLLLAPLAVWFAARLIEGPRKRAIVRCGAFALVWAPLPAVGHSVVFVPMAMSLITLAGGTSDFFLIAVGTVLIVAAFTALLLPPYFAIRALVRAMWERQSNAAESPDQISR